MATANNLETSNESIENEMTNMLPKVLNELSEYGLETDLQAFLQLVCENRFPFSNIAFQLGIEIVRLYRQDSSTTMRYMDKTKTFWKLRWRLFVSIRSSLDLSLTVDTDLDTNCLTSC